jgi:hypothetical protein
VEERFTTCKQTKKVAPNRARESELLSKLTTKHSLNQSEREEVFSPVKTPVSKISEFNSGSKRASLSQNGGLSSQKKEDF